MRKHVSGNFLQFILTSSDRRYNAAATYLVLDEFPDGRVFRETDEAEADRETVIEDIVSGQYKKPVRVIAFNTAEGWARDVTEDIAREIVDNCEPLTNSAPDFVKRVSQPLAGAHEDVATALRAQLILVADRVPSSNTNATAALRSEPIKRPAGTKTPVFRKAAKAKLQESGHNLRE